MCSNVDQRCRTYCTTAPGHNQRSGPQGHHESLDPAADLHKATGRKRRNLPSTHGTRQYVQPIPSSLNNPTLGWASITNQELERYPTACNPATIKYISIYRKFDFSYAHAHDKYPLPITTTSLLQRMSRQCKLLNFIMSEACASLSRSYCMRDPSRIPPKSIHVTYAKL